MQARYDLAAMAAAAVAMQPIDQRVWNMAPHAQDAARVATLVCTQSDVEDVVAAATRSVTQATFRALETVASETMP